MEKSVFVFAVMLFIRIYKIDIAKYGTAKLTNLYAIKFVLLSFDSHFLVILYTYPLRKKNSETWYVHTNCSTGYSNTGYPPRFSYAHNHMTKNNQKASIPSQTIDKLISFTHNINLFQTNLLYKLFLSHRPGTCHSGLR